MDKTLNTIRKFKLKHGERYNYSEVKYISSHDKVKILCNSHGEFEQSPTNHLAGNGCPKCVGRNKTTKDFIKESKSVHGDKYDYSLVKYIRNKANVSIICNIHGSFKQNPSNHLAGNGCPKCVGKNKTIEDFLKDCKEIHNDRYDYSLVEYVNTNTKVKIICDVHGVFEARVSHHLAGGGCPKCVGKNKTTKEFIKECKLIHGEKYDYSLVEYINCKTKVKIICDVHGEFEQTPIGHKSGKGCAVCNESKGERAIREFLTANNIEYIPQHKFKDCRNIRPLPFDFYLSEHNICVEYNGIQHYEPVEIFGGETTFKLQKKKDEIKKTFCRDNNIKLIIINDVEDVNSQLSL